MRDDGGVMKKEKGNGEIHVCSQSRRGLANRIFHPISHHYHHQPAPNDGDPAGILEDFPLRLLTALNRRWVQ